LAGINEKKIPSWEGQGVGVLERKEIFSEFCP
jgi:hypothetical protein